MNKEIYKNILNEKFESNFSNVEKYFEFETVPTDLKLQTLNTLYSLIYQNLQNLIFDNYIASITITSHLLEKFCKLSIVKYDIIGENLFSNEYNNKIESAYRYDSKDLNETIKQLHKYKLISQGELKILLKLKNEMRNAFSHADSLKITKDYPNKIKAFHANFNDIEKLKVVELNTKTTFIKNEQVELEAQKKAFSYFKQLYKIIVNVDYKLRKAKL